MLFVVRPEGNKADVEQNNTKGRTTWVQGQKGWYVDENETRVLKKEELEEMPNCKFSLSSSPNRAYILKLNNLPPLLMPGQSAKHISLYSNKVSPSVSLPGKR